MLTFSFKRRSTSAFLGLAFVTFVCILCLARSGAAQENGPQEIDGDALKKWGQAEIIAVADLTRAIPECMKISEPLVHRYRLEFTIRETLRGRKYPRDTEVVASFFYLGLDEPKLSSGRYVVSFSAAKGLLVTGMEPFSDAVLRRAKMITAIPIGWGIEDGNLISPWADLGKKGWKANASDKNAISCMATGRPALLAGPGVELTVKNMPSKMNLKFKNRDGDGEYKITLRNRQRKEIHVPALLTTGKEVLWNESLVIICQGQSNALPDAKGVPEGAKPLILKPGESVSTVIQVLKLKSPDYPRVAMTLEFRFCLGEHAVSTSFYYFPEYHDKIREALKR